MTTQLVTNFKLPFAEAPSLAQFRLEDPNPLPAYKTGGVEPHMGTDRLPVPNLNEDFAAMTPEQLAERQRLIDALVATYGIRVTSMPNHPVAVRYNGDPTDPNLTFVNGHRMGMFYWMHSMIYAHEQLPEPDDVWECYMVRRTPRTEEYPGDCVLFPTAVEGSEPVTVWVRDGILTD
jgi:hypothetical protein